MTDDSLSFPDRRTVLRGGGLGLAAAAFLAACGKDSGPRPGISGGAPPSTAVAPTVPAEAPSEQALLDDQIQLATAASVALLAADTYGTYGPKLTDPELVTAAERFGAAHQAAADDYLAAIDEFAGADEPNTYLAENFVGPAEEGLVDDRSIASFFAGFESMIAASAVNAVGIYTEADWRQRSIAHGAAAARRATYLTDATGADPVPQDATFSLLDLMPGNAFLAPAGTNEAEGS